MIRINFVRELRRHFDNLRLIKRVRHETHLFLNIWRSKYLSRRTQSDIAGLY